MVELLFMMVILKLPVLYLAAVVWWAVRAEPQMPEEAAVLVDADPAGPGPASPHVRRRRPRSGPHGAPSRRPAGQPASRRAGHRG